MGGETEKPGRLERADHFRKMSSTLWQDSPGDVIGDEMKLRVA